MKHFSAVILTFFLLVSCLSGMPLQKKAASSKKTKKTEMSHIPQKYKKWLLEEVGYIITPFEQEVFVLLQTDRERDLFIEAFWKHRDTDPLTSENEFKIEHYKRFEYANTWFGKLSPGPGWRSDQGRIYITLGPPNSVEQIENNAQLYPIIIWHYQGLGKLGLPDSFNVVFFRKDSVGEYELYSPMRFGPQSLLIHYQGDPNDYLTAYRRIMEINPIVANISLSLIPGEPVGTSPSMASEMLIKQAIPVAPYKKISTTYAEKMLRYKDVVETEYSANYIDSSSHIEVIRGKSGEYEFHYLIEPRKLALQQFDEVFSTNLEVSGNVTDPQNRVVFQFRREFPIKFDQKQLNNISNKLFSFQDVFPLIPGTYQINILLKNSTSREFTSLEKKVNIPDEKKGKLKIQSFFLANRLIGKSPYAGQLKPFLFGDKQLVPSPRNDFVTSDTLYLFAQILHIPQTVRQGGFLTYRIFNDNTHKQIREENRRFSEIVDPEAIIEKISLDNIPPGYYRCQLAVKTPENIDLIVSDQPFYISPLPNIPRPWIMSVPKGGKESPLFYHTIGIQYTNVDQVEKAVRYLEKAYRMDPRNPAIIRDYCRSLLSQKKYELVKSILGPFVQSQPGSELSQVFGEALQKNNEPAAAIEQYQKYINSHGLTFLVLNQIGECYLQLEDIEEAALAWQKSLEINPAQPQIREKLGKLKIEPKKPSK